MVVVVTDSEAVREFERGLVERGGPGFTVVPRVWGSGRTGLKAGDRIHPGGSSLLFTVVPDAELPKTLALLHELRERAGAGPSTKTYVLAAEEVA